MIVSVLGTSSSRMARLSILGVGDPRLPAADRPMRLPARNMHPRGRGLRGPYAQFSEICRHWPDGCGRRYGRFTGPARRRSSTSPEAGHDHGGTGGRTLSFVHTLVEPNYSTPGIAVVGDSLTLGGRAIRNGGGVGRGAEARRSGPRPERRLRWQMRRPRKGLDPAGSDDGIARRPTRASRRGPTTRWCGDAHLRGARPRRRSRCRGCTDAHDEGGGAADAREPVGAHLADGVATGDR